MLGVRNLKYLQVFYKCICVFLTLKFPTFNMHYMKYNLEQTTIRLLKQREGRSKELYHNNTDLKPALKLTQTLHHSLLTTHHWPTGGIVGVRNSTLMPQLSCLLLKLVAILSSETIRTIACILYCSVIRGSLHQEIQNLY